MAVASLKHLDVGACSHGLRRGSTALAVASLKLHAAVYLVSHARGGSTALAVASLKLVISVEIASDRKQGAPRLWPWSPSPQSARLNRARGDAYQPFLFAARSRNGGVDPLVKPCLPGCQRSARVFLPSSRAGCARTAGDRQAIQGCATFNRAASKQHTSQGRGTAKQVQYKEAMADNLSKEARSFIMSRIRSKDTVPELIVRRFLHRSGYRFRLHRKDLPGKPDIVLPKYHIAIMVHGCFWHAHRATGCTIFKMPSSRSDWWREKLEANQARDRRSIKALKQEGWRVIVVWECQLHPNRREATLKSIVQAIQVDPGGRRS